MCVNNLPKVATQWNSGATRDSNPGRRARIPSALTTRPLSHTLHTVSPTVHNSSLPAKHDQIYATKSAEIGLGHETLNIFTVCPLIRRCRKKSKDMTGRNEPEHELTAYSIFFFFFVVKPHSTTTDSADSTAHRIYSMLQRTQFTVTLDLPQSCQNCI